MAGPGRSFRDSHYHDDALVISGGMIACLGQLLLFASFKSTNYNGDPEMPAFSDGDSIFLVTLSASSATLLYVIVLVALREYKAAMIPVLVSLLIAVYRLAEVVPHFEG